MKLEQIGFYTLTDERARNRHPIDSPLRRCEMLLTSRCNFHCPYCRPLRAEGQGDIPFDVAVSVINTWANQGLTAIRFSGGEPMMYSRLGELVALSKARGISRIALSTNGSFPLIMYEKMMQLGVNDFSISLDACCASTGESMCGGVKGAWNKVVSSIEYLAKRTYVTVGTVLTDTNIDRASDIVKFADSLGVSDIRIIPAAQYTSCLKGFEDLDASLLARHPILKFRVERLREQKPVRGIGPTDNPKCSLMLDDMPVAGGWHFPCIIYLREGGKPIGKVGPNMRQERAEWYENHNSAGDPICSKNCLDFCVTFNNRVQELANDSETR